MRIALLADSVHTTPLIGGHGLGWIVYNIAERLHSRGHDVTMYAAQGSMFSGKLVTPCKPTLNWSGEALFAQAAYRDHKVKPFDVFMDNGHMHIMSKLFHDLPVVNMLHDKMQPVYRNTILGSEGQRKLMLAEGKRVEQARVIRYQFNKDEFTPNYKAQPYALFLGSLFQYKQPVLAIEACARMGLKLVVAGDYGERWMSSTGNTEYVGVAKGEQKDALIRNAAVLVHPGNIEACPIVDIEAGLSGTPVAAWAEGGHTDFVREGCNGSLMDLTMPDKTQSLCEAIARAVQLNRRGVRAYTAAYYGNPDVQTEQIEKALCDVISGETWQ